MRGRQATPKACCCGATGDGGLAWQRPSVLQGRGQSLGDLRGQQYEAQHKRPACVVRWLQAQQMPTWGSVFIFLSYKCAIMIIASYS